MVAVVVELEVGSVHRGGATGVMNYHYEISLIFCIRW